jgi:hypothetical protein
MKPIVEKTSFGSITVDGVVQRKDIVISMEGSVLKRKKKLSKKVFGTSHVLSLSEAEYIFQDGAEVLIIGTGQYDQLRLSQEAEQYFREEDVEVILAATPEAIKIWNERGDRTIGLFHITC